MLTARQDVVTTNSASSWLTEVVSGEFKRHLKTKLREVLKVGAIKVNGPRNNSDISYILWRRDYENWGANLPDYEKV